METAVQETGLLSGARFGRVTLEGYQLAPALRLLAKPRARLLIADDVGLGKTIEAGLALLELMARGRASRVLVVVPAGLLLQWQEEMRERFGLEFVVIESAAGLARVQGELPAGTSPWDALPRVLTSVDFLKKETVRHRALRKRWDLVIVDEAHALAESGTPANPYRTQRTRLGLALREASRGLLLLTATPHNGYVHSFRSLIDLVEPAASSLHGSSERIERRVQRAMIRRLKAQILRRRPDGTMERVFPVRDVQGIAIPAAARDAEVLRKVSSYCSKTARNARDEEDADLVTFAMQIVKKRSLSSRRALEQTLAHRLEALRTVEAEPVPDRAEVRDLQADLPLDEAAAERTVERIVRATVPRDERWRRAESRALTAIRRLLRALPGSDPKIEALLAELHRVFTADPSDKVIVFTEYRDTLEAIQTALEASPDLAGRSVILRGGLTPRQRARVQQAFERSETRVLLGTDAASEGLNLQRACHRVIHFELPWNPNRLEQRNGRVDRYGQREVPIIRYLYYPASAEEDVLHQLVTKIERMQQDQVSTPDILGLLTGAEDISRGLVELDPEDRGLEGAKASLVRVFEDRTTDFIRTVKPLVAATTAAEERALADLLQTGEALLADDDRLEGVVRELLGAAGFQPQADGIVRIEVALRYRGPGVVPAYPRATFRRSVAARHRAEEVEFITPLHPLVQALAAEARRRLLQVYPDDRGLPARRVAARRVRAGEPPSGVFTFLAVVEGGGGLLEESLFTVRVGTDGRVLGVRDDALRFLDGVAGEVDAAALDRLFETTFPAMASSAREAAARLLGERADRLAGQRREQAALLREDLDTDLADRLTEIDEEERRARGLVDERSGQGRLFAETDPQRVGFQARRAAATSHAEARLEEIAEFEQVRAADEPRPLGVLLLVPEDVA
jgi:superfamily II DNA or RNA helicase